MENKNKLVPPGIMVCAALLVFGGLAMAVIGTSAIQLKGQFSLSFISGLQLFETIDLKSENVFLAVKGLLAIMMIVLGIGLATCKKESRISTITLLFFCGILFPVLISIDMKRIDFEFIYVFRFTITAISAGIIYYLTRKSTIDCFYSGGVPTTLISTYCPICELTTDDENCYLCPDCECEMSHLYEADTGYTFASPLERT